MATLAIILIGILILAKKGIPGLIGPVSSPKANQPVTPKPINGTGQRHPKDVSVTTPSPSVVDESLDALWNQISSLQKDIKSAPIKKPGEYLTP